MKFFHIIFIEFIFIFHFNINPKKKKKKLDDVREVESWKLKFDELALESMQ